MDSADIAEFLSNKSILITGATGFISKIVVEKILRIQPNVKKLYLLIRAKDATSALERLHNEIIGKDLFNVLRDRMSTGEFGSFIAEKVIPAAGDASSESLGIVDPVLKEEMWADIDIIVHGAAATDFFERYDVALAMNTFGAKHMVDFAKKCAKLQVFVHVSTAYLCGEKAGLIPERQLEMGETIKGNSRLDIKEEKKLVDRILMDLKAKGTPDKTVRRIMRDLGNQRAREYGWQNVYEFTKAMGEMLIGRHRDSLPAVILRPTIVSSTYTEPFPGWIEGIRTIDSVAIAYGKGKLNFLLADRNCVLDLIPADMVVNSIIASTAAHANQNSMKIYQVGTSLRNPVTFGELHGFHYDYYTKHPWINRQGKAVKIRRGFTLSSTFIIDVFFMLWYSLLLKILKLADAACFHYFQDYIDSIDRKVRVAMKLIDIFKPYLFFKGIFEDHHTEKLRTSIINQGVDEDGVFNFDPKSIDWEYYFNNVHIPAIMKYLF